MAKKKAAPQKPAKTEKKKKAAPVDAKPKFEFEGKVESINVKGDGAATLQTLFSLVKRKGEHFAYVLDNANPTRHLAMLSVLTAAFGRGTKVKINTRPDPNGGEPIAIELEIR